ncbi:hypothetical protein [Corynebacterium sp. A21]|uniref:hypothetical protein n=1 Tax=Corynebacterium sp. A21 TaxID=3457318 RepID=UPI003FCF1A66
MMNLQEKITQIARNISPDWDGKIASRKSGDWGKVHSVDIYSYRDGVKFLITLAAQDSYEDHGVSVNVYRTGNDGLTGLMMASHIAPDLVPGIIAQVIEHDVNALTLAA